MNPKSLDGGSALCPGIQEAMHAPFPEPIQPVPPSHRSLHPSGYRRPSVPTKAGEHRSKILELRKRKHGRRPAAGRLDTKLMQELIGVERRFFMFTHLLSKESHPGILSPSFQQDLSCPQGDTQKGAHRKDLNSHPGSKSTKFNKKASHNPEQHKNIPISPSPVSAHKLSGV